MKVPIVYEPVDDAGFPKGYYYAHLVGLGLTTHGKGIEGAGAAAQDLIKLWIEEKEAQGEPCPVFHDLLVGTVEV